MVPVDTQKQKTNVVGVQPFLKWKTELGGTEQLNGRRLGTLNIDVIPY